MLSFSLFADAVAPVPTFIFAPSTSTPIGFKKPLLSSPAEGRVAVPAPAGSSKSIFNGFTRLSSLISICAVLRIGPDLSFDDDAEEDEVGRGWRNPEIVTGRLGGFFDDEDGSDAGSWVVSSGGGYVHVCEYEQKGGKKLTRFVIWIGVIANSTGTRAHLECLRIDFFAAIIEHSSALELKWCH